MKVVKILNNNALVADDGGRDVVAIGLGIAFRYPKGAEMPEEAAEQIFVASKAQPLDRLSAFLTEIPLDNLRVATEICEAAPGNLARRPPESLISRSPTTSPSPAGAFRRASRCRTRSSGRSRSSTRASSRPDGSVCGW